MTSDAKPDRLTRIGYRLVRFGPVRKVRSWYKHLSRNDQRAVNLLVIFFAGVLLYFAIWQPVRTSLDQAEAYYESRRELYQWVQSTAPEIRELQGKSGGGTPQLGGQSLLTIVTTTAKEQKIEVKRYEPKGENAVSLWLEGVPFNTVITWLDSLRENYSIQVSQISVDRESGKSGVVTIKIALSA